MIGYVTTHMYTCTSYVCWVGGRWVSINVYVDEREQRIYMYIYTHMHTYV